MSDDKVIVYEDDLGFLPKGRLFYPESLRLISPALAELNAESMQDLGSYSANILMELNLIVGYFKSFHDTHLSALAVYEQYRTEGRQYCLYLRSFSWAGIPSESSTYLSALDRDFRRFLKQVLPREMAILSFANMLDLYPGNENEQSTAYMDEITIPSLRVLNHNWKEVAREVVRGARLVVLNAWGESEGISTEIEMLSECGMEGRTIVTGARFRDGKAPLSRFSSVFERGEGWLPLTGALADEIADAIRSLSTDDFRQTNGVRDLSGLPCWIIDRNIATAARHFSADELAGVPYDYYIPSSLANNWMTLTAIYPQMVNEWQAIEAAGGSRHEVGNEQLRRILDIAVHVFYVAATLERYYEMAMALSTIGLAHRAITRKIDIMMPCYGHAAQCARWSRDSELSTFLADAYLRLKEEAAELATGP